TGANIYHWLGRTIEALGVTKKISALHEEEDSWEDAVRWRMEGHVAVLRVYVDARNVDQVRRIGTEAFAIIQEYERRLSPLTSNQNKMLRSFCHNMGLPLRGAQQYDLALPMLERAVKLGMKSPWTYLSLAAALWATTKDKDIVLPLLKHAALNYPIVPIWDEHSRPLEFADVADDPDFLAAVTLPTGIAASQ
ncbi:MAG: hypothetical protein M3Y56_15120, partial [Armatimonadota bacterium]|nr:hypothetical protein [Armatimonadota bacterium]